MPEAAMAQHVARMGSSAPEHPDHVSGKRALTETQEKAIQMQGTQMVGVSP